MANSDTPFGFKLVGHTSGSPMNARLTRYSIPASDGTAVFIGDAVKSDGSADSVGVPGVIQAAAGNTIRGVVVAFEPLLTNLETKHRLASTLRYALVCDDPEAIYEVQEDSVGNNLAATDVGDNFEIIVAAGSTVSGLSGMELDSSTAAGATAQLRVLGLVQRADNEIGANAKWLVRINEHELDATAGV